MSHLQQLVKQNLQTQAPCFQHRNLLFSSANPIRNRFPISQGWARRLRRMCLPKRRVSDLVSGPRAVGCCGAQTGARRARRWGTRGRAIPSSRCLPSAPGPDSGATGGAFCGATGEDKGFEKISRCRRPVNVTSSSAKKETCTKASSQLLSIRQWDCLKEQTSPSHMQPRTFGKRGNHHSGRHHRIRLPTTFSTSLPHRPNASAVSTHHLLGCRAW